MIEIDNSELEKQAPQVLTKFALKLGFLTKKNYFEIQRLYHLVAKDWKETFQILRALLAPNSWQILHGVFEEWLFAEIACGNRMISRAQADHCIQKRLENARQRRKQSRPVAEEEKFLKPAEIQKIREELQLLDFLPKSMRPDAELPKKELLPDQELVFGRYKIAKKLGQGGMGSVYQAYDTELERTVALKVLHSAGRTHSNPKRFFREARLMARLSHPNIVKIYDFGEWKEDQESSLFFTMECIDGAPLDEIIQTKQLTIHQSAEILRKMAIAISYAHKQGIIHRDIKPSNIMVDQDGEPWLMDFGLAKVSKEDEKLSKTGSVLGTPVYMSPEQAAGKIQELDESSDIYSLGALFYEMLTKTPPFRGDSSLAIILQVINSDPPPLRKVNPKIPRELEGICMKAMEKIPAKRYASGEALADDLHRFLRGLPVNASPPNSLDLLWRRIERNRTAASMIFVFALLLLATGVFWSYKEYRLLKNLQDCMKLVLGLQQVASSNPADRESLIEHYISSFSRHIELNRRNAAAYLGRGLCHIMLGEYEQGYTDLSSTIDFSDYSPLPLSQLYLLRAECSIEHAHYAKAMVDLQKAGIPDSRLWVGRIYSDLGRYERAIAIFDEIILASEKSGYSCESYLMANALKADILSKKGEIDDALLYSRQAVECIPYLGGSGFISVHASTAYTIRAIVYSRAKDYPKAMENFEIALQWMVGNEAVFSYRGKLHAQRGDFARAIQDHNTALQTPGNRHFTHYNIAGYFAIKRDVEKALHHLELALQRGFRDFTWLRMDPDLASILADAHVQELVADYEAMKSGVD